MQEMMECRLEGKWKRLGEAGNKRTGQRRMDSHRWSEKQGRLVGTEEDLVFCYAR